MLKGYFIFWILSMLTGNPLLALILLAIIYVVFDRAYVRLLPDFMAPFRRRSQIRALRRKIDINPADAASSMELGILLFEKKDFREAHTFLTNAYEKIKNSARLFFYLGMTDMELGDLQGGQAMLQQALQLDHRVGHGLPYVYLLKYEFNSTGRDSERLSSLEKGLNNFANTENFFRMGAIYEKLGIKEKAVEMYHSALQEYSYVPSSLKKLHRKWALLSRLHLVYVR